MADSTWVRLLKWMRPLWKQTVAALLLGVATVGSGMGLMMTSAYIISAAALHPSIAVLQVAIVGVRVFGISRGVARYFERLVSHNLNLTLLTQIRVWVYERLEPLAPARLQSFGSGDLLTRIVADVNGLEHFYVRVLAPPLVAGVIWLLVLLIFSQFGGMIALVVGLCMAVAGVMVPGLVRQAGLKPGQRQIQARKEMNEALVEGIQGLPDLLAFGAEERYLADIQRLGDQVGPGPAPVRGHRHPQRRGHRADHEPDRGRGPHRRHPQGHRRPVGRGLSGRHRPGHHGRLRGHCAPAQHVAISGRLPAFGPTAF